MAANIYSGQIYSALIYIFGNVRMFGSSDIFECPSLRISFLPGSAIRTKHVSGHKNISL